MLRLMVQRLGSTPSAPMNCFRYATAALDTTPTPERLKSIPKKAKAKKIERYRKACEKKHRFKRFL